MTTSSSDQTQVIEKWKRDRLEQSRRLTTLVVLGMGSLKSSDLLTKQLITELGDG